MNTPTPLIATALLAASLVSGSANAVLLGRDLDGYAPTFEAYYDTVLDITWLADGNYAQTSGYGADGLMSWNEANTWAAQLNINGYDNWRLPTVNPVNGTSFNYSEMKDGSTDVGLNITSPQSEMAHLFYVTLGNPGYYTPAGAWSGCSDTCLDNVGPFTNLQANVYWSATEYAPKTYFAWNFGMSDGAQAASYKVGSSYALAVSPGDVGIAAVPEPETYAMMLAGLGLIGAMARRRKISKV